MTKAERSALRTLCAEATSNEFADEVRPVLPALLDDIDAAIAELKTAHYKTRPGAAAGDGALRRPVRGATQTQGDRPMSYFDPRLCCAHIWYPVSSIAGVLREACEECHATCRRNEDGAIVEYDAYDPVAVNAAAFMAARREVAA